MKSVSVLAFGCCDILTDKLENDFDMPVDFLEAKINNNILTNQKWPDV